MSQYSSISCISWWPGSNKNDTQVKTRFKLELFHWFQTEFQIFKVSGAEQNLDTYTTEFSITILFWHY